MNFIYSTKVPQHMFTSAVVNHKFVKQVPWALKWDVQKDSHGEFLASHCYILRAHVIE